jgi:3-oxoacyl-[acyl-carrier protein] reductase
VTVDQIAIVTGAAQGLGEVIARTLHAAGYRIAVADIDADAARAVAIALDPTGETACAIQLDVRQKPSFAAALDTLVARWGAVDLLVNNAAMTLTTPVMEIAPEEFDSVIAVNLRGTFLGCQVFGAYFRDRGYGRIVNMASLAGENGGTATGAHYAASKGGIMTVTKVFARELAGAGVTVNAIAPGPLDVPSLRDKISQDKIATIEKAIPVGHIGDPAFVAATVLHLASPAAASVTGAIWDMNGGLLMR